MKIKIPRTPETQRIREEARGLAVSFVVDLLTEAIEDFKAGRKRKRKAKKAEAEAKRSKVKRTMGGGNGGDE